MDALAAFLLLWFGRRAGGWTFETGYHSSRASLIEAFATALLIGLIVSWREAVGFLKWPVLVWMGDVSYSSYLFHMVILAFVAAIGGEILNLGPFQHPASAAFALAIFTLAISTPLAALSYQYIEIPGVGSETFVAHLRFSLDH